MSTNTVTFSFSEGTEPVSIRVPNGTLLAEATQQAGIDLGQPCGGQGRCGRCVVQVVEGNVRRRSTLRLSVEDVAQGFALACQSVVEGDVSVLVPPQDKIERRLTTDRTVAEVVVPEGYDPSTSQTIQRLNLVLSPPDMDDQTDDWSRLQTALRKAGYSDMSISLPLLRQIGAILRSGNWQVSVIVDTTDKQSARLISLTPGSVLEGEPLWGVAIDIGTTTVTLWLVDLTTGQVRAQVAEYNGQIARGEDIISRILYASKNGGNVEMQARVLETIHQLLEKACKQVKADPEQVVKVTISGNSTMIHLLLDIPASSIRLSPFITAVNHVPLFPAREIGLHVHPEAVVDCLPGVASYVGADITAGVLSSGVDRINQAVLFLDVGTNGETVLGNKDFLVTCACSAGPAFEGAGVLNGMRATEGAIEEVWINGASYEPTFRVIGGVAPVGLCGSGLISLLSEMFLTGLLDKAGNINLTLPTKRVRQGEHGPEYVIVWADKTKSGEDISITRVDVDNLLRAKAAIYAGFTVLSERVGIPLESSEQVLIGGSFGKYINIEKAIQIGLLPDMPWERFQFLGNTSVKGAYYALIDHQARLRLTEIAARMTYIELSADNTFYEAFMSAMFLPHTDLSRFPSVAAAMNIK